MLQAVRQHVVVQPDWRIVIHVPQLKPGTHVEVTVVEDAESEASDSREGECFFGLIGSYRGMFATSDEADAFLAREREAWGS